MYASVVNEDAGKRKKLNTVILPLRKTMNVSVLYKLASFRITRDGTTVTALGVSTDPEFII